MRDLKTVAVLIFLALSFTSCQEKKPEANKAQNMAKELGDKTEELGKDIRQEACEMVDGEVECMMERMQRDVKDSIEEI